MVAIPLSLLSLPSLPVVVASVMLSLLAVVVAVQVGVLFGLLLTCCCYVQSHMIC